jgi:Putative adhesin
MNRLNRTLYLLPIVLLALGCGEVERRHGRREAADAKATITRSWPAAEISRLRVFEIDGSITVEAEATDTISLVATAQGNLDRKAGAENDGLFETRLDGDTLRIGRKEQKRKGWRFPILFGRNEMRIHYVLKVPTSITLDVSTINGRIVTRGSEGETEASTVNGTIDIETAGTQELQATTVNGRVRARFTRDFQGAKFKTVNGGVEAFLPQNASFNVDLSQVNGDFEAAFPLNIHSNPGSRRVSGEVNGGQHELKIVTVNGDVELARLNGRL